MKDDFTVLQSVYKNDDPLFLSECFDSLFNQTLKPQKIILIKDGTLTQKLEDVISDWKEKLPLKVVGYENNQGLAHALNFGLQFVETELVARMDSDDVAFPERFEKQVKKFETDKNLSVLGTGIEEFYNKSDGTVFTNVRLYPESTNKKKKKLFKGTPLAHPTVMLKTEILKNFCYNEKTKCNEDIELWFRLLKAGIEFNTLQEALLNFRITDSTFKRRSFSKSVNEFKIYFSNLFSLFGFSWRLIFPVLRLFTRFLPYKLNRKLYLSNLRKTLFKNRRGRLSKNTEK